MAYKSQFVKVTIEPGETLWFYASIVRRVPTQKLDFHRIVMYSGYGLLEKPDPVLPFAQR